MVTRVITPLAFILLFCVGPAKASSVEMQNLLEKCSKEQSHVEMSACLARLAASSEHILQRAQEALIARISTQDESAEQIEDLKKALTDGQRAFEIYRTKMCGFYAASAAGGNGAHDLTLACEAELNSAQTKRLNSVTSHH